MSADNFKDYFHKISKKEIIEEFLSYQGVDNRQNKIAASFLDSKEEIKDINIVKESNDFISPIGSADSIDILIEDKLSRIKKEDEGIQFNVETGLEDSKHDFSNDSDSQDEAEEKSSVKSRSLYKSIFTVNVKSLKSKYTCKLCGENLQYHSQLWKHFNAHENGFKCDFCPKVYSLKSHIAQHVLVHMKKFSVCCYCNQSFTEDKLLEHLPTHFDDDGSEDACEGECNDDTSENHTSIDPFKQDDMEFSHSTSENSSSESKSSEKMRFDCLKCNKSYGYRFNLRRHMITSHGYHAVSSKLNSMIETEDRYYCSLCERCYAYERDLKKHTARKHPNEITVDPSDLKFECLTCSKKFRFSSQLHSHQTFFHLNLTKFCCNCCGKTFEVQKNFKKHLKVHKIRSTVVESEKSRFECNKCDRSYKYPKDLKRHMRDEHNIPYEKLQNRFNNYKCIICLKTCQSLYHLNRHKETHKFKGRFECNKCNRSYKYPSDLKRHLRDDHDVPDEILQNRFNNYKCIICLKSCQSLYHLNRHKETHGFESRFECTECDRSYKYKADLNRHMKNSHNSPPDDTFSCKKDNNSFTNEVKLIRHLNEDHIFQPDVNGRFNCEKCSCSYKYRPDLRKHIRDNHNDEPISANFDFTHKCEKCGKKIRIFSGSEKTQKFTHSFT